MNHERDEAFPKHSSETPSVGYALALSRVKMRVFGKGMMSFHLKLKAPWKYINTSKNIKELQVYLNCTRPITFKRNERNKDSIEKKAWKKSKRLSLKISSCFWRWSSLKIWFNVFVLRTDRSYWVFLQFEKWIKPLNSSSKGRLILGVKTCETHGWRNTKENKRAKKHQTIPLPYHELTKQRKSFTGFYTEVNPKRLQEMGLVIRAKRLHWNSAEGNVNMISIPSERHE